MQFFGKVARGDDCRDFGERNRETNIPPITDISASRWLAVDFPSPLHDFQDIGCSSSQSNDAAHG